MTGDAAMPPFAILAGGMATRLGDVTRDLPKALLPIAGRPFIDHQLRLLARQGVQDVVLCLGHFGEQIEAFAGDGASYGIRLHYSYDGPTLIGTGGALRKALPLLGDEFVFMYGDSYLDTPLAPVVAQARASGRLGLMAVYRNQGLYDKSNADLADGLVRYDKQAGGDPPFIDYGLSWLRSEALAAWHQPELFDIADVLTDLSRRGELAGFEVPDRFYEIGSHAGLAETEAHLASSEG